MRNYSYKYLVLVVLLVAGISSPFAYAVKFRYTEFELLHLPVWRFYEADEDTLGYYPGGGLWPEGCLPEKGVAHVIAANEEFRKSRLERKYPSQELEEGAEEAEIHDPKVRYLVDEPKALPELPNSHGLKSITELPAIAIEQILADKPADMLMDPQNFLQGQRVNDIMRFLELQNQQSKFEICAVVLSENQKFPELVDLNEVHQKWFGVNQAALMIYHVNAPEKTQLILGSLVSTGKAAKLLKEVLPIATEEMAAEDQLENLTVELSIQLYGLEIELNRPKVVERVEPIAEPEVVELTVAELKPVAEVQIPETVFNLNRPVGPVEAPKQKASLVARGVSVSAVIVGLAAIMWGLWLLRKRSDRAPITFPVGSPQPRLGGEFSGGAFYGMALEPTER